MASGFIRFYGKQFSSPGTVSRKHVNCVKKHINALASGDKSYDHEIVDGLWVDGVTLHDVFVFDGRVLIYAFEKLSPASVFSNYFRDFAFQYLFLADKGKGHVAALYREYPFAKPDFHHINQAHCYGFLEQPLPQIAEILNKEIQLFKNSLSYFKQWKAKGYNDLTYFASASSKGLQVVDYLLRVSGQETALNGKALRRNLCKKIFPPALRSSANHAAICDMFLPFAGEACCLALINCHRGMQGLPIEPWGKHAEKAAAFICEMLDYQKIDFAEVGEFFGKIGLGDMIPNTFKRNNLSFDLGI
jgi:hypothetical protein